MDKKSMQQTLNAGLISIVVITLISAAAYMEGRRLIEQEQVLAVHPTSAIQRTPPAREVEQFPSIATYYGKRYHGRKTASYGNPKIPREHWRFSKDAMTCAHKTLPLGTMVRSHWHDRHADTMVTDRMPGSGRIDLSAAAFRKLAPNRVGKLFVIVEVLP